MSKRTMPVESYGVLDSFRGTVANPAVEQLRILGYAVVDAGYSHEEIENISERFARVSQDYLNLHGRETLASIGEEHTIRALLAQDEDIFLQLAMNPVLMNVVKDLIVGKFILNQQNGIINPPKKSYNQAAWHRDLPYQHFVSSRPLALNALYCVDDFTLANGCTFVLPASHKIEGFPGPDYIEQNAVQIEAKAGSFIVLDCMLYHCGGYNGTAIARRAVNHLFTVPYIKQQIDLPKATATKTLSAEQKSFLGYDYPLPESVNSYLASRKK